MLFTSLALHVAAAAVSHGDAVGGGRGREERRGTVCTWNVEMSSNKLDSVEELKVLVDFSRTRILYII
jgi:hypothetical protein